MTMRAKALSIVAAVILEVFANAALDLAARESHGADPFNALILEDEGKAGGVALGQPLSQVLGVSTRAALGTKGVPVRRGVFAISANASGNVQRIDIRADGAPGLFTTRLIRMDDATATDVLASYDAPRRIDVVGDEMIFDYGKFEFRFPFRSRKSGTARLEDVHKSLNNPLKSMSLKIDEESTPSNSVHAASAREKEKLW